MSGGRVVVVGDVMTDVVASLSGPVAPGSDTPARVVQRGGGAGRTSRHGSRARAPR